MSEVGEFRQLTFLIYALNATSFCRMAVSSPHVMNESQTYPMLSWKNLSSSRLWLWRDIDPDSLESVTCSQSKVVATSMPMLLYGNHRNLSPEPRSTSFFDENERGYPSHCRCRLHDVVSEHLATHSPFEGDDQTCSSLGREPPGPLAEVPM